MLQQINRPKEINDIINSLILDTDKFERKIETFRNSVKNC